MKVIGFTSTRLPYGWMGNMSPYPIKFGEDTYKTTEALFQALRFSDNDIKALIREEKSPMGAKAIAKSRAAEMTTEQLSDKDVLNMRLCIALKLQQHPKLVEELLATGDDMIVEDVTKRGDIGSNLFWGAMLVFNALTSNTEWVGKNVVGNIWMDERKKHQILASEQKK